MNPSPLTEFVLELRDTRCFCARRRGSDDGSSRSSGDGAGKPRRPPRRRRRRPSPVDLSRKSDAGDGDGDDVDVDVDYRSTRLRLLERQSCVDGDAAEVGVFIDGDDEGDEEQITYIDLRRLKEMEGVLEGVAVVDPSVPLSAVERFELQQKPVHQMARDGDLDLFQKLCLLTTPEAMRRRVNARDGERLAPLHYAARYHHLAMARALVACGADVNLRGVDGLTALHFAAKYRRIPPPPSRPSSRSPSVSSLAVTANTLEVPKTNSVPKLTDGVQEQLDGAGDKARQARGETRSSSPLSTAEDNLIAYLLSQGARINEQDIYGLTPLHYAAMRGSRSGTPFLLADPKANIEAEDKQKIRPLHMACLYGAPDVVAMLVDKGAELRARDDVGQTPLHKAAMVGHAGVIRLLLEAGAASQGDAFTKQMVEERDNERNTPLHHAVDKGLEEICQLLLEVGADANALRYNGASPLHLAAKIGDVSICRVLAQAGARINALNLSSQTPLHRAAAFDRVDCVDFLIDRGANVDATDRDGFTALLLAASEGQSGAVAALIRRGASLAVMDKNEKTAIYWSAQVGDVRSLAALLARPLGVAMVDRSDRNDNSPLHVAAAKGYLDVVRLLLDTGAQIDNRNDDEATPLHLAVKFGRTRVVRELIRRDRSVVTDEDENADTALHIACYEGHDKAVKLLLEAGADVEARNGKLWTPLDCAAQNGHVKCVRTLVAADAPLDPVDKTRTTPLQLAARRGHDVVVVELLRAGADVSARDANGYNALELAVVHNHKQVAESIVDSDQWREALSNERTSPRTGARVTPLRMLIKKFPDVAERVFSRCVRTNGRGPDDRNFSVTFVYEFVDDTYAARRRRPSNAASSSTEADEEDDYDDDDGAGRAAAAAARMMAPGGTLFDYAVSGFSSVFGEDHRLLPGAKPYADNSHELKKNHPLTLMCRYKRTRLLGHPLTKALLRNKWKQFGRYFYYFNLVFYCVFLALLTRFVLSTPGPAPVGEMKVERVFPFPRAVNFEYNCTELAARVGATGDEGYAIKVALFVMAGLNLIKEIFQIFQARFWRYFKVENVLEWTCYVTALILVLDFEECSAATGLREPWQWAVGAVSIFLAWINLLLFIKKFPYFGIYVIMFTDIFTTFSRFFLVFFLFVIAFALGFFALLQQQTENGFGSPSESLVKTFVMMVGEFEFSSIFYQNSALLYFPWLTYTLFTVFVIVMSIIIMNLLVGLAVDDIKGVQDQAVLNRLAMQVALVLDVEAALPEYFRRRTVMRQETIVPGRFRRLSFLQRFLGDQSSLTGIIASLEEYEEDDRYAQLHGQQKEMYAKVLDTKRRVKVLRGQMKRVQGIVEAIAEKMEVAWEEQEDDGDSD